MKFFLLFLALGFILFYNLCSFAAESPLDTFGIKMTGSFKTIFKNQRSYKTPFDHPEYGYNLYSGASHRSDQPIRATGEIDFYFGDIGKTEWFGGVQLYLDANDPDTETGEYNESFVELGDLILMYRPFEFNGGRPFGITMGIQTIPFTMNGFTTYLFEGDVDLDFPCGLMSGLMNVPAVTIDFFVNEKNGIGLTYAKGCSHISEVGTFMHKDSAKTLAFWFNGQWRNINFSGAYQHVEGNRGSTDTVETDNGNTYSQYENHGFKHYLLNSALTWTFNIKHFQFTPFVGYQKLKGDETPLPDYSNGDSTIQGFDYAAYYDPRSIEGELRTIGFILKKEIFNKPNLLCVEYTDAIMDDFGGIDGLKKGAVDRYLQPVVDFLFPTFDWSHIPIAGLNSTINKFSDIDYVINAEYTILFQSVKVGIFYYMMKANNDYTINNEQFITGQISERLKKKLMAENNFSEAAARITADVAMVYLRTPQNMNGITLSPIQDLLNDTKAAEWTDSQSMGIFLKYAF